MTLIAAFCSGVWPHLHDRSAGTARGSADRRYAATVPTKGCRGSIRCFKNPRRLLMRPLAVPVVLFRLHTRHHGQLRPRLHHRRLHTRAQHRLRHAAAVSQMFALLRRCLSAYPTGLSPQVGIETPSGEASAAQNGLHGGQRRDERRRRAASIDRIGSAIGLIVAPERECRFALRYSKRRVTLANCSTCKVGDANLPPDLRQEMGLFHTADSKCIAQLTKLDSETACPSGCSCLT